MKNYGTKSEILLHQQLITETIIMKNISKSNLIQMMIYLCVFLSFYYPFILFCVSSCVYLQKFANIGYKKACSVNGLLFIIFLNVNQGACRCFDFLKTDVGMCVCFSVLHLVVSLCADSVITIIHNRLWISVQQLCFPSSNF